MAYDPLVINAVESVRDRFGADGLRSLIELAKGELNRTEAALTNLAPEAESEVADRETGVGAETRQFQAYVAEGEQEGEPELR